jgi:hypothetical protein
LEPALRKEQKKRNSRWMDRDSKTPPQRQKGGARFHERAPFVFQFF